METIVPAILPANKRELADALSKVMCVPTIESVQIDVVDGVFATPASWPYTNHTLSEMHAESKSLLRVAKDVLVDVDLMVTHPEEVIADWIDAGAARLTVHAESVTNLSQFLIEFKRTFGHDTDLTSGMLALGLAINLDTPLVLIEPYLSKIDYVQFMGIATIGKQGQPFDPRVIRRITSFHKKYPEILIQVDGGVTLKTAPDLLAAGAGRLIVGHALTGSSNVHKAFDELNALSTRYGVYE